MRLNRYLSQCGVASRRGAEEIILGGRVSINGHVITDLATQVESDDKVVVDGSPVRTEQPVVIVLNKPKGYICSRGDTHERMTIYDLLPRQFQTLHHVGRLDKESEGLILLTNRGDLSHRIIHPSQGAEKEYEVVVDQAMTAETMAKLAKGMLTEEGFARAERAWLDSAYRAHVVLKQGLKRQIRLMFYTLGYEVTRLTRIRIGWLQLRGLPKGSYKELTPTEVERFFKEEAQKGREPPPVVKAQKREYRPRGAAPAPASASSDNDFDDEPVARESSGPKERAPGRRARKTAAAKRASAPPRAAAEKPERTKRPQARSRPSRTDDTFDEAPPRAARKYGSNRPFNKPRSSETGPDERPRGRPGSKPTRRPAPPEGRQERPRRPRSR